MICILVSPWLSLGIWWDLGFSWRTISFLLFFLFFLFFFFFFFSLFNGASCAFKLNFQLSDRCDLKSSRLRFWIRSRLKKLAVILSVCIVRVGWDVFESARLMLRVGSLQSESARLSVHTLALLIESARLSSSRLERPVTFSVILVESALGPLGRLEWSFVLNILRRATIESARLLFESARVHKFRKLELQLD